MAGKKARKKPVKTPFSTQKLSPAPPSSCNQEAIPSSPPSGEAINEETSPIHPIISSSVKVCRHLEKGVNIDLLSSKLSKARFSITHCQDCAKDSKSAGGKKGKGRSARKKGGSLLEQSASQLHKKWVCLACGHIGCGSLLNRPNKKSEQQESGVDNEKIHNKEEAPMGHASKHARCANHPLALQIADSLICWCFTCNKSIDCTIDASPQLENGTTPFQAAVDMVQDKLLKEKGLLKDPGKKDATEELVRCHVDDASQSNSPLVLPPGPTISMQRIGSRRKRTVKGLMNLGNTCFFNSVMQNLLALDTLRDYFSQEHVNCEGPLTSSLRKLYLETNIDGGQLAISLEASGGESGFKKGVKGRAGWEMNGGACNPRSLFGAICAKAPRFRGFQQQDSHELLRCLLDGLTLEERSARAAKSTCNGHLSKGVSAPVLNGVLPPKGDCSNPQPPEEEMKHKTSENAGLPLAPTSTIVESFFGGQLCSMVRCCECGHSSVVYETMLDLSLQIPTQPTSRRGQRNTNQWKPSSFLGGCQQREGSQTKGSQKESLGKVLNTIAVVETNRSSTKAVVSAQGSETYPLAAAGASSPKLASTVSSPFDDVWLDFIDCGVQSAESSMQGSADVSNSIETTEKNLVVDIEDCGAESTLKTALDSSTMTDPSCQVDSKTEVAVSKEPMDCVMPSESVQNRKHYAVGSDADTPKISAEKEVLKPFAHSEGEDGPLPLASGVLLLSYEPLEVSSNSRGEESSASFDLAKQCRLTDVSYSELEADGDLDGFALLFEEEESSSAVTQDVKPSGGNLEGDHVVDESSWDDGIWEADTAAYDRSEATPVPQRLANYEGTILPMSLESCLADFTKTELLSGENAWECESCTQRLKEKGNSGENTKNSTHNEVICESGDLGELQDRRKAANSALLTPRNCFQEDNGRCHLVNTTQNGNIGEGRASLLSENNESSSSRGAVLDHKLDKKENGSIHLRNSNGDQHYESPSPPCDDEEKSFIIGNNQQSIKEASDMPKSEQANVTGTLDHADNSNVHLFDAEPHVGIKAQQGRISSDHRPAESLPHSGKEKSNRPVSKSAAEAKCRTKSKLHAEKLVKKDATKKLSISKAPTILTVHLKRFAQDMRGRLSKLNGHVSFPEFLDLRPFLDPRCLNSNSCYYQLIGVVEHGGTMRGGHYIAYVRSADVEEMTDSTEHRVPDSWYYVSDSSVRKASLQAVLNSEAYLLFYEKCEAKKAE